MMFYAYPDRSIPRIVMFRLFSFGTNSSSVSFFSFYISNNLFSNRKCFVWKPFFGIDFQTAVNKRDSVISAPQATNKPSILPKLAYCEEQFASRFIFLLGPQWRLRVIKCRWFLFCRFFFFFVVSVTLSPFSSPLFSRRWNTEKMADALPGLFV